MAGAARPRRLHDSGHRQHRGHWLAAVAAGGARAPGRSRSHEDRNEDRSQSPGMGRRENRNEDRSINIFEPCGEDVADIHQLL